MGVGKRQQAIRAMRGQIWSPGRPSTARREDRVWFWEAIARGLSSEDAAGEAGVSQPVGSRWFRQAGGMPPICLAPVSERYLSFAEREEIAILNAQYVGVSEIARRLGRSPSTISRELRRNASTRSHGVVYRATDTDLKRDVAIKVLPESFSDDADRPARFQREAEVLASLNHSNIAQIYGLEKAVGKTVIVMELVEGPYWNGGGAVAGPDVYDVDSDGQRF